MKATSLACVFSKTKTLPLRILTRRATGCDIFVDAARTQLVMACKPDTAQVVELLALAQWAGRPSARR